MDFQLKLGASQQTVTVEATPVAVQSDTGEQSYVVTGQQVTQLATNGRSMYTLEALVPGASSMQSDFQVPTSTGGDAGVSFNGLRMGHNLWLVDGGETDDRGGAGGSDVMPSMDAIAEFRTLTSNYSAEYGLSSGGTMSLVIKSGTKQVHGEAWYFGRNDALDARNYFNPAHSFDPATGLTKSNRVAELRFHTFGFNIGGPLTIHPHSSNPKTFFFYNMEWRRLIQGQTLNQTVPLTSEYPGANGAGTGAVFPTGTNGGTITVPSNVPTSLLFRNCGGAAPPGVTPGQPFPNNTIPACMIDPNAAALLAAGIFPAPTQGNQFIGGNNAPTNVREEVIRLDHTFTDKFSVFGHFIADQVNQTYGTTQWSADNVPTVFDTFKNPGYAAVIHVTNIIHPNLLNEVQFNYNGNRINIFPAGVYKAPPSFTFNRVFANTSANALNRLPSISLGNLGTNYTSAWEPWVNTANDYQIRDDVSWTKGAHQFRIGAGWALYAKVQDYFANTQGGFNFNGNFTNNDFGDFLLGLSQKYTEDALKSAGHWNNTSPFAYIQDNWRATHRLTLNLGLRWDGIPHTYEANHNQANFYPSAYNSAAAPVFATNPDGTINYNAISPSSPGLGTSPVPQLQGLLFYMNGIGIAGKAGVPKGFVNDTWDAFGPRLGFAYDLTGSGNTVIRGGFGIMYERIQGNDMYNAATNNPFDYHLNVNNVLLSDPHVDLTSGAAITLPIPVTSITALNKQYKVPTSYQYSIGVQRALGRNAVFSISYVGNQNRWQSYSQEIDLPPAGLLPALACNGVTVAPCPGTSVPQSTFNSLVSYPGFSSVRMESTGSNSHYNSLQTEVHGRIHKDLQLQASYTFAKAIDPTTGNLGGGDSFDLDNVSNPYLGWRYDLGPSPFDRRHTFFVDFVYDIPVFRNSGNHLLRTTIGGWELSGIVMAESGLPVNVGCSGTCTLSVNGQGINTVASVFPGNDVLVRPDLVAPISYPKSRTTVSASSTQPTVQWFSPSSFAPPAPGTWGNLPFDALRGPGRQNWNLSLFKEFVINENRGSRLEFRAESFNTLNHTQFGGSGQNGGVSANLGSSTFGKITSAWDPRVFQLGLKLIY